MRNHRSTTILLKQAGQATMEGVLLTVLVVAVAGSVSSYARSEGLLAKIVEGPWSPMRGMIENGVWVRYNDSKTLHPNHRARHQSRQGE